MDRQPTIMELLDKIELPESNNEIEEFQEEEIIQPENVNITDQKELINAYTAGFFDGEGCIRSRNNPPSFNLYTTLSNTDLPILTKLKQEYGGGIYDRKTPIGKEHWKQAWSWDITDRPTLKKFLQRIYPYSIVKKSQIELGIKLLELTTKGHSSNIILLEEHKIRQLIYDKFKELKDVELSSCELNVFNIQIQEMNVDKNQPTIMECFDSDKKDIEIIKVETEPIENKPTYYSKELIDAYTSGFFDGEGCITIRTEKETNIPSLELNLTNTNLQVLTKIKKEYNGEIYTRKKNKEHHKDSWKWRSFNKIIQKQFLQRIYTYSIVKKPQIELGLKFLELITSSNKKLYLKDCNKRKLIADKLHELKHTELSECELNTLNTQIEEMNIDKNQHTMMDY